MDKLEHVTSRLISLNETLGRSNKPWEAERTVAEQERNLTAGEQKKLRERAQWKEIRLNQGHRAELRQVLDELCLIYLTASSDQRESIRSFVKDQREVLLSLNSYLYRALEKFKDTGETQWLKMGLASVAIENLEFDYRDTLIALGEFFLTVTRAGLDPIRYLIDAAAMASTAPTRVGHSAHDFLLGFTGSAYFVGTIKPKLRDQ